jgi:hypothetical protein
MRNQFFTAGFPLIEGAHVCTLWYVRADEGCDMDKPDIFVIECANCGYFGSDSMTVGHISEAWFVEKEDLQYLQQSIEETYYENCCDSMDLKIVRYKRQEIGDEEVRR